jgi:hypothetical protein
MLIFEIEREMEERLEQERLDAEEEKLSEMTNEDRNEYLKLKYEEKMLAKQREQEERHEREEEELRALNEMRRKAEEDAARKWELSKRLKFLQNVREEGQKLEKSHMVNQAFVYSYFELVDSLAEKLETIKDEPSDHANSSSHLKLTI